MISGATPQTTTRSCRLPTALMLLATWLLSASCQTFEAYGQRYQQSTDAIAGVPPLWQLTERQAATAARREAVLGEALVRELESCEHLRGQLAHASRAATTQVACVWGCPLAWPFDLLSLLVWPIGETQKAQAVWAAAERLERAYQTETRAFLAVCAEVKTSEVGRAFSEVLVIPRPAAPPPEATDDSSTDSSADSSADSSPASAIAP